MSGKLLCAIATSVFATYNPNSCPLLQGVVLVSLLVINKRQKQPGLGTADDDRWHVMIVIGTLNVGYISLTIQRKSDLKALSSENIMINKCIDYSHVIR